MLSCDDCNKEAESCFLRLQYIFLKPKKKLCAFLFLIEDSFLKDLSFRDNQDSFKALTSLNSIFFSYASVRGSNFKQND